MNSQNALHGIDQPVETQLTMLGSGIYRVDGFFPPGIVAIQTTRQGGCSKEPFDDFNMGDHVGDDPLAVAGNRGRLAQYCSAELAWLSQVHGTTVTDHQTAATARVAYPADAVISSAPQEACLIMTADCLPILIARPAAGQVAAIHAGWRGLCDGVIEATLERLTNASPFPPTGVDAWWVWLGPAIGQPAFEVGHDVRALFMADPQTQLAFRAKPGSADKWLADLKHLARMRLRTWFYARIRQFGQAAAQAPVVYVAQQNDCVFQNADRYFSYRRDRITGRMASLIYRV